MINWRDQGPVTDEDLVALLDGQLERDKAEFVEREVKMDRALEQRLEQLRRGERPFAEAYDLLLEQAPEQRLREILKQAKEPPPEPAAEPEPEHESSTAAPPAARRGVSRGGWRFLAAAAVLLAVFAGGIIASRFVPLPAGLARLAQPPAQQKGWRAAVAEYQALFVKATLEQSDLDPGAREANLRAALGHLGLDLSVEKVSVEPLDFKRAEVLAFGGKPLVQMAYLLDGETPVSFCIIRNAKPAHGIMTEQRLGLNVVHWQSSDYGFMVIGAVPAKALGEIARKLHDRLS